MIKSFKHKGLRRLFEDADRKLLNPAHAEKIQNILTVLDAAEVIDELNIPGFRAHVLSGDLKGFWAVTVRANWRIIFRFEAGNALDVASSTITELICSGVMECY